VFIEQLAASFVATAAFGMIFNVPKRALAQCGLSGMFAWILFVALTEQSVNETIATLIAAGCISVLSQLLAKLNRMPVIVFSVSGIIPLVPGGIAYNAMRHAVENQYSIAMQLGLKAFMISGAIALGLVLSEVINQAIRKVKVNADIGGIGAHQNKKNLRTPR
jgi:uncharacterized membrane protein YjjB (DUF3815 family)